MPKIARKRREQHSFKWNQYPDEFLPLWVADMDFAVCPAINEALRKRTDNETFGYTNTWPSLLESVVHWCREHYDWQIQQDWIVWTQGVVPAFHLVNQLFQKDDSSILIPTPNYPPLLNSAKVLQQTFHCLPHFHANQRWHLDFDALEIMLKTQKVSILSLANPANPSGYVFSESEINKLSQLCLEHNVLICSDEIHCDLVYNGHQHTPIGKVSPDNSITLMAASKTFNIAGLNTAFAIIPDPSIRQKFSTAARHQIGSPTLLGLTATETAFSQAEPWRLETLEYLQQNRDIIYQWGSERGLDKHYLPAATHLYWLKIPTKKWVSNKVMPSNGVDFGDSDYSRINFACDRKLLKEALSRLG